MCFPLVFKPGRSIVSRSLLTELSGLYDDLTPPEARGSLRGRKQGREGEFVRYYREYIEVVPDDGSPPYVAEVRLCHDFPEISPTGDNQLVVLDDRVVALMSDIWAGRDMPTDTWGVLAC